jgi:hypothetical protein
MLKLVEWEEYFQFRLQIQRMRKKIQKRIQERKMKQTQTMKMRHLQSQQEHRRLLQGEEDYCMVH